MRRIEEAQNVVNKYGQEHLLQYYNELTNAEQNRLLEQILSIDFEFVSSLYIELVLNKKNQMKNDDFSPLKPFMFEDCSREEKELYYNLGMEAIKKGKVGVMLVAGGQGTRLGHTGPKGTFSIGLPSNKSLFQLQCERLINLSLNAGRFIPWYIMTSPENHMETIAFFRNNNYFGYKEEYINFFKQGVIPLLDEDGKILLSSKSQVSTGPSGNGSCFNSLRDSGMLDDIYKRGIEWMFLYGIDNSLVRVADPYFMGFTIKSDQLAASKVVSKLSSDENVGVLCYKNGHPAIVEYTELSSEMVQKKNNNGELIFNNANIINHIFHVDFITESLLTKLPFHIAHKKIPYINEHGVEIIPEKLNGYKFESFLFDTFTNLNDMAVLNVKREEEFAPVKNRYGLDSPETAKKMMLDLHRQWLISQGCDSEVLIGKTVEISPLTSYYGENIDLKEALNIILTKNVIEL